MTSPLISNLFILILVLLNLSGPYILAVIPIPTNMKMILSEYIFLLIPSLIYIFITRQDLKKSLSLKPLGLKSLILLFLFGILIQPSMTFLGVISTALFKNNVSGVINELNKIPFILSLFTIAITPAICEEVAFRGAFASGYKNINIRKAAIMNGIVFAILHFDGQQFLYAFVMGVIFAYLVYITKSIFSSMFVHFIFNGSQLSLAKISSIVTQVNDTAQVIEVTEAQILQSSILLYAVLTFMTLPVLFVIFKLLIYISKQQERLEIIKQNQNLSDSIILAEIKTEYIISNQKVVDIPFIITVIIYICLVILPLIINNGA